MLMYAEWQLLTISIVQVIFYSQLVTKTQHLTHTLHLLSKYSKHTQNMWTVLLFARYMVMIFY